MPRRKVPSSLRDQPDNDPGQSGTRDRSQSTGSLPAGADTGCLRVLIVGADAEESAAIIASLSATLGASCSTAGTPEDARAVIAAGATDVVIICCAGPTAESLASEITAGDSGARVVLVTSEATFDAGVRAVRCGASDCLARPVTAAALARSVRAAGEQARRAGAEGRRLRRLRRICRKLSDARRDAAAQVDELRSGLLTAYTDISEQMDRVSMAGEFGTLISQELDVEGLLRTTLEFTLTRTGPTNAAVFLPTGPRDYSLGAYINFDIPRETADVLLDHLGDTLPARFENLDDILVSGEHPELDEYLSDGAAWIAGTSAAVFSCREQGECLGVAVLFRDRTHPFSGEVIAQLRVIRDLFTRQLARVIHVTNRHKRPDEWPGYADDQDDYGLAA